MYRNIRKKKEEKVMVKWCSLNSTDQKSAMIACANVNVNANTLRSIQYSTLKWDFRFESHTFQYKDVRTLKELCFTCSRLGSWAERNVWRAMDGKRIRETKNGIHFFVFIALCLAHEYNEHII